MTPSIRTAAAAVAIATVGTVAAAPSGAATPKKVQKQTLSQTYVLPTYETNETILGAVHVGGGQFDVPTWARYVSVTVADQTGLPTAGSIWREAPVTDQLSQIGSFCGRTAQSYPITASVANRVWVDLQQGPCADGTLGAGSVGTISVTFTS